LPKFPGRVVVAGALTGLFAAVGLHVGLLLARHNLHVVVPGRVFRSSQMSGPDLEAVLRRHGIRTVVNLRGLCPDLPAYVEECRVTQRAGVSLVDIGFSAGRLPPVNELRYLVEALDRSEYPILLHCRQGVDRTGLVSALVLLLYTDTPLDEAVGQLDLSYGHVALGRTANMRRFFALYRGWLGERGLGHSRAVFRRWLEVEYCAGACSCAVEPLDVPRRVPVGRPWGARFRVHNTSAQSWRLRPAPSAGFHMGYLIIDEQFRCASMGRAGLFDAEVRPGESVEITAALPALKAPGKYTLVVDMVDEQQGWFYQHGGEPWEWKFEVVEELRTDTGTGPR
jgi:protein tyrosine phosphatase (PTP) superfamily phosphohydrolase (DUF442 family)